MVLIVLIYRNIQEGNEPLSRECYLNWVFLAFYGIVKTLKLYLKIINGIPP